MAIIGSQLLVENAAIPQYSASPYELIDVPSTLRSARYMPVENTNHSTNNKKYRNCKRRMDSDILNESLKSHMLLFFPHCLCQY